MDDPAPNPSESVPAEATPLPSPPAIPPVIGEPLIPTEPSQPQFKLGVTLLCTAIALLAMGWMYASDAIYGREAKLDDPERDLHQVMGRQLDADELAAQLSTWRKWLDALQGDKPGEALRDAIAAYEGYTAKSHAPSSTRSLIILLAEAGRLAQARRELDELEKGSDEEDFIAAVHFAYWPKDKALPSADLKTLLAAIQPAWARDKLEMRIAERRGDRPAARTARTRIEARGARIQKRMGFLNAASTLWMLIGLAFLLPLSWRRAANWQLGNSPVNTLWSGPNGFAVLVRGEALGQLLSFGISTLAEQWVILTGLVSFLTSLPMLWLGSRYLLQPIGKQVQSCFGLDVPLKCWSRVVGLGVALTGISLIGESVISALLNAMGFEAPWADFMPEELLWKSWSEAGLDTLNTVVCAPVCEELIYRGFLYGTLRRRFGVIPAALLGSLVFSLGHGYSVDGLLTTAWSGFIWSLSFEKTRSLLPGMISHALGNALVSVTWIVLW